MHLNMLNKYILMWYTCFICKGINIRITNKVFIFRIKTMDVRVKLFITLTYSFTWVSKEH
jgi:hypothetical protein